MYSVWWVTDEWLMNKRDILSLYWTITSARADHFCHTQTGYRGKDQIQRAVDWKILHIYFGLTLEEEKSLTDKT